MSYSSEVLADSPLFYLRLGDAAGSTVAADASGNGRTGAYAVAKVDATGLIASDPSNTATTTKVSVADAAYLDVTAITVEAWVTPSLINDTNKGLVARFTGSGTASFIMWRNTVGSGQLAVRFYNASGTQLDLAWATAPTSGSTYHVVATYTSGDARLYINGAQVASSAALTGNLRASAEPVTVGYYGGNTAAMAAIWDEVAYYDTALSDTRVAAHYSAGVATAITVSGEAFSAAVTMLDGSALTAVEVAGEVFSSAVTALDGTVAGTTLAGEAFASVVTMLDGTATSAGTDILVDGEVFSVATVMLDGGVLATTDTSNALDGLDITFVATADVPTPVAAVPPSLVPGERYEVALPYPVPVMVDGRPT